MSRTSDADLEGNAKAFAKMLNEALPGDVRYIVIMARADGKFICLANAPQPAVAAAMRSVLAQQELITVVRA